MAVVADNQDEYLVINRSFLLIGFDDILVVYNHMRLPLSNLLIEMSVVKLYYDDVTMMKLTSQKMCVPFASCELVIIIS